MPENTNNNGDASDQTTEPEQLEDIVGTKLTIRQAQDKIKAAENLNDELSHVTGASPLSIKVKLFAMLERLAQFGKLRMPKQFNKEAKLGNKKHFYAVKPHNNIRAYGWHSSKFPSVFFISHYKYKKKQKLDSADTEKVKRTWRGIENE
ncbi:MAG: hypothetical protein KZQ83_15040 [gamma proteobacterium symbiont of Taylorina sp.]|nr:hypothetical protein [gamma proteobacterium symbiont of Taylorina sp.]